MPLYEFECNKCHRKFELLRERSMRDEPAACPDCGGSRTKRQMISTFAGRVGTGEMMMSIKGAAGCGGCKAKNCKGCKKGSVSV